MKIVTTFQITCHIADNRPAFMLVFIMKCLDMQKNSLLMLVYDVQTQNVNIQKYSLYNVRVPFGMEFYICLWYLFTVTEKNPLWSFKLLLIHTYIYWGVYMREERDA